MPCYWLCATNIRLRCHFFLERCRNADLFEGWMGECLPPPLYCCFWVHFEWLRKGWRGPWLSQLIDITPKTCMQGPCTNLQLHAVLRALYRVPFIGVVSKLAEVSFSTCSHNIQLYLRQYINTIARGTPTTLLPAVTRVTLWLMASGSVWFLFFVIPKRSGIGLQKQKSVVRPRRHLHWNEARRNGYLGEALDVVVVPKP